MPTTLTLALLLHPPCASLLHSSASRMLFRRSSPSGSSSSSSSPSSSSTSLAPRLGLKAIDVPDNASNFAAYLADARALVDDFERGLEPASASGWKAESAHGVDARVASCKGARLAPTTKELVDEHETWIGRVSEHDDVTYDDFFQHMLKDEEGKGGQHVAELPAANVVSTYEPSTLPDGLHSAAVVHIPQLDMPFPLAGRAFLSLVVTATADNEFWNVSVPVQDEAFPPGKGDENGRVRARQVAVERVRKLPSGKTEWISITAFTLGGNVPQRSVDKQISNRCSSEITQFVDWIRSRR